MPYPSGLITLLTDFGDRDSFVASMKGVILTINPQATIVDLSHHISPHAIDEAAYLLKSCYTSFPEGTVHVAVVDPGVGTVRRPLLAKTERYFFLAPDNGLLSFIVEEEHDVEVREIENKQFQLESAGTTFDGRDLFAPAAGHLTTGQSLATFGRLIRDPVRLLCAVPRWENYVLVGEVVYIDRFGNLISNVTRKHLDEVRGIVRHRCLTIRIRNYAIEGLVNNYSEGSPERISAIVNSNNCLELFLREKSAAQLLKLGRGESIYVS